MRREVKYAPADSFEGIDYQISSDQLINYSSMRLIALGASITLVSALSTVNHDDNFFSLVGWNSLMVLLISVSIRIIGSINSNVYAKCIHLENIEQKFQTVGFFTNWNRFVVTKQQNASSNAFLLACIAFNVATLFMTFYSMIELSKLCKVINYDLDNIRIQLQLENSKKIAKFVFIILYSATVTYIFFINRTYIRNTLKAKVLIPRLRKELDDITTSILNPLNSNGTLPGTLVDADSVPITTTTYPT